MAGTDRGELSNRFGFVANLQSRDGGVTKDARMHNAFADGEGPNLRAWMRPALGSGVAAPAGGFGQGMISDGQGVYAVAGGTLYGLQQGFSFTVTTNGSAAGFVGIQGGYFYRVNLANGKIYRAVPNPSTLQWTLISTAGSQAANPAQGQAMTEGLGYLWGAFSFNGTTWNVVFSTDGVTWAIHPTLSGYGAYPGPVLGFSSKIFSYPTTFTGGAAVNYVTGTGTAGAVSGTMSLPGTMALDAVGLGTGGGKAWVWGTAHGFGKLISSTDGLTWSLAGTGAPPAIGTSLHPNRIGYVGGNVYIPFGTGPAGGVLTIPPGSAATWSTAGTFAIGTAPNYKALLPAQYSQQLLMNDVLNGYDSPLTPNGAFVNQAPLATVSASVSPIGIVKSRTNNKIVLQGNSAAYIYDITAGTSGQITGANFPTNMVPGLVYLDATYYVMDVDGNIWNSTGAADDPTTWPTDGLIVAEFEPDPAVCLTKALNYVVAMKQWSIGLFWDAGNPTASPLSPVNNGVILIGCASAGSVVQTESTVIWIAQRKGQGSTAQKGRFIAMLIGTSYEELSTPDVNRILDNDSLATVYASVIELGGHTWYVLGLLASNLTLVYDMKKKLWYTWSRLAVGTGRTISNITQTNGYATGSSGDHGFSDGDPVAITGVSPAGFNGTYNVSVSTSNLFSYPISTTGTTTGTGASMLATPWTESYFDSVAVAGLGSVQLIQDSTGAVMTFALGTYTDLNGIPINLKLRTNNMDGGNNENKFCHSVALLGDVLSAAGYGLLRYTDNDFQTYGYYRRFDLSQVRSNEQRWGYYRRRAWEFRYTGASQYRLLAAEPEITQGVT